MREKDKMERELNATRESYEEYKEQLDAMRQKQLQEKRERAKATLAVSQRIATEREGLVESLDSLRSGRHLQRIHAKLEIVVERIILQ